MRLTNLTLSANGYDSVKFLGLVGWGDESLWKEKRMRSASQKRAHCSNLCIVTAKRRVTHIYVTICLGFFFPHKFPFLLPPSVLPSGEEAALWRRGFLFEKSGRQSRGCFNRLYKYLHSHGLTPWTTYYSISLFLFPSRLGSGADRHASLPLPLIHYTSLVHSIRTVVEFLHSAGQLWSDSVFMRHLRSRSAASRSDLSSRHVGYIWS